MYTHFHGPPATSPHSSPAPSSAPSLPPVPAPLPSSCPSLSSTPHASSSTPQPHPDITTLLLNQEHRLLTLYNTQQHQLESHLAQQGLVLQHLLSHLHLFSPPTLPTFSSSPTSLTHFTQPPSFSLSPHLPSLSSPPLSLAHFTQPPPFSLSPHISSTSYGPFPQLHSSLPSPFVPPSPPSTHPHHAFPTGLNLTPPLQRPNRLAKLNFHALRMATTRIGSSQSSSTLTTTRFPTTTN